MSPLLSIRFREEAATLRSSNFGIRRWHNALRERSSHPSASRVMVFLKAALDLAGEDFGIRPPVSPKIDRVRGTAKKTILTPKIDLSGFHFSKQGDVSTL